MIYLQPCIYQLYTRSFLSLIHICVLCLSVLSLALDLYWEGICWRRNRTTNLFAILLFQLFLNLMDFVLHLGLLVLSLFSSTISVLSSACNFGIPTSLSLIHIYSIGKHLFVQESEASEITLYSGHAFCRFMVCRLYRDVHGLDSCSF